MKLRNLREVKIGDRMTLSDLYESLSGHSFVFVGRNVIWNSVEKARTNNRYKIERMLRLDECGTIFWRSRYVDGDKEIEIVKREHAPRV